MTNYEFYDDAGFVDDHDPEDYDAEKAIYGICSQCNKLTQFTDHSDESCDYWWVQARCCENGTKRYDIDPADYDNYLESWYFNGCEETEDEDGG